MDYNLLNGPQRKLVREILMTTFRTVGDLDMFLDGQEHTYLAVADYDGNRSNKIHGWIMDTAGQGHLSYAIRDLKNNFKDSPHLMDLDAKLIILSDDQEAESGAKSLGGLERITRKGSFENVFLWANEFVSRGAGTCRIRLRKGSQVVYGSGFLIAPDLVLTAYHVVEDVIKKRALLADLTCTFGFAEQLSGLDHGIEQEVVEIVSHRPYSTSDLVPNGGLPAQNELDFAVLKLAEMADGATKPVDLTSLAAASSEKDIIFILQYPMGHQQKHSIGVIVDGSPTPLRLRYDANTLSGSSGALVLSQELQPLALHHAGDPNGKIRAEFNQGIPLHLIADVLKDDGILT